MEPSSVIVIGPPVKSAAPYSTVTGAPMTVMPVTLILPLPEPAASVVALPLIVSASYCVSLARFTVISVASATVTVTDAPAVGAVPEVTLPLESVFVQSVSVASTQSSAAVANVRLDAPFGET